MKTATNKIGEICNCPWGTYETLALGTNYQTKRIIVNPGGKLSLQKHFKRSEHWVVIQGHPTITVGENKNTYDVGDTINITTECIHRMENLTNDPAAVIEVQIGDYLGEDDIVRLEDIYNRS